ncbi:hypothetical protein MASR2M29_17240 [Spirochaetota bacterium]
MNSIFDIKNFGPLETQLLLKYKPGQKLELAQYEQEAAWSKGQISNTKSMLQEKNLIKEAGKDGQPYYCLTEQAGELANHLRAKAAAGKRHPFSLLLDKLKDLLVSQGFVELEDFYPEAASSIFASLLQQTLSRQQPVKNGKYFRMGRCIDPGMADAGTSPDFWHVLGLIGGEHENLKTMAAYLEQAIKGLGYAKDIQFIAAYSPFLEPSFEILLLYPGSPWISIGHAGLLRPEAAKLLNATGPLFSWEFKMDGIATAELGLSDRRELYSPDISVIRSIKSTWAYLTAPMEP